MIKDNIETTIKRNRKLIEIYLDHISRGGDFPDTLTSPVAVALEEGYRQSLDKYCDVTDDLIRTYKDFGAKSMEYSYVSNEVDECSDILSQYRFALINKDKIETLDEWDKKKFWDIVTDVVRKELARICDTNDVLEQCLAQNGQRLL